MKLSILSLQIAPQKIGFLKFILEGYDGLALLSTQDPLLGDVTVLYPEEMKVDVLELLASLSPTLSKVTQ